ncbi:AraC family transcriptional regulator [Kitasatospora sp. NPDC002227]|uniref:AraC family transcriptional regulator n=1 Tax=Kitasatospora sp. NPDC002227 TaxID=3154773 RepID=UPI0033195E45
MLTDDTLSSLLMPLRLRGVFRSRWTAGAPWAVRGREEDCAVLHYLTSGSCLLTLPEAPEPVRLHAGDLALFPHGTEHTLSDAPGRTALPLHLALPDRVPGSTDTLRVGGSGEEVRLMCGGLHHGPLGDSPFYRSLPAVILMRRQDLQHHPLLVRTLESLAGTEPGSETAAEAITLRAFELVLLLALHLTLSKGPLLPAPSGTHGHPGVGRALGAMSGDLGRPWTLPELAREAAMSRTTFSAAFRDLLGEPPARHLTRLRMQEAARLLTETTDNQHSIAAKVGYRSTVGLHLAFRKWFDMPPGEYRSRHTAHRGSAH